MFGIIGFTGLLLFFFGKTLLSFGVVTGLVGLVEFFGFSSSVLLSVVLLSAVLSFLLSSPAFSFCFSFFLFSSDTSF